MRQMRNLADLLRWPTTQLGDEAGRWEARAPLLRGVPVQVSEEHVTTWLPCCCCAGMPVPRSPRRAACLHDKLALSWLLSCCCNGQLQPGASHLLTPPYADP